MQIERDDAYIETKASVYTAVISYITSILSYMLNFLPYFTKPTHTTHTTLKKYTTKQIKQSWRCDMHPVYSRDGQYMAVNVRSTGGDRQVAIMRTPITARGI